MNKLNIIKQALKPVEKIPQSEINKAKKTIKTMDDLDTWRINHPKLEPKLNQFGNPHPHAGEDYIMSRYETMIEIYGKKQADKMMRELEVQSWDKPKNIK